jgi:ankyrin repeat protein
VSILLLDQGLWDPDSLLNNDPMMNEAATDGDEELMHMILEGLRDLDDSQRWVRIAQLYHSARTGNADTIKQLLEDTELPLDLTDQNYCTPLRHAVRHGHLEVVSLLIDSGREIRLNHFTGKFHDIGISSASALGVAVFSGHVAIVKRLLQCQNIELDRNVHLKGTRFRSIRELAEEKNYPEIVDAITECEARQKGVSVAE